MFKNLITFKINGHPFTSEADFKKHEIGKLGALGSKLNGWCPIIGDRFALYPEGVNAVFFCMMTKEKILPTSVIDDAVQEEVFEIEKTGVTLSKSQIKLIKSDVIDRLLAIALIRRTKVNCFMTTEYLFVDSSSPSKADEVISLILKTFPEMTLSPFDLPLLPEKLTQWGKDAQLVPDCFLRCGAYVIKSPDGEKQVRMKGFHDGETLGAEDFVREGEIVTEMSLSWEGRVTFMLTSNAVLKQVYYDLSKCDEKSENPLEVVQAETFITASELVALIEALQEVAA